MTFLKSNFYQSQLRITIERAFGVLVHRWSILRGPLNIPLFKVVPLVQSLCKLHNYCIDERLRNSTTKSSLKGMTPADATHLNRLVKNSRRLRSVRNRPKSKKKRKERTGEIKKSHAVVELDTNGAPSSLLGGGEHFNECPRRVVDENETTNHPLDDMLHIVRVNELTRPTVNT